MTVANQIQSDLERAVEARQEHQQLTRRLEAPAPHLADLEKHVADRRKALEDEAADVERLESFSVARIWAGLKGSHASDLERETAERDAARYAVAEAEARRDAMQRDRMALESRLRELGDVEERYREALARQRGLLVDLGRLRRRRRAHRHDEVRQARPGHRDSSPGGPGARTVLP